MVTNNITARRAQACLRMEQHFAQIIESRQKKKSLERSGVVCVELST